jgi:prepilin-type N-terminal cleavage/methylation domain-containing protein
MNDHTHIRATSGISAPRGFTLIELLVVIAVIALLASLLFPITKALNRTKIKNRAKGELTQIETCIESYKAKLGFYPPDTASGDRRFLTNQLYFELAGTDALLDPRGTVRSFKTLDGASEILPAETQSMFGTQMFMNSSKSGGSDDEQKGVNFLVGIRDTQLVELKGRNQNSIRFLVSSVPWPNGLGGDPWPYRPGVNPWRYVSSAPIHNSTSYDLWVDVVIDGKTNRICNWSKDPVIVGTLQYQ